MTQGIGARIQRKEDARHLHGRGNFVSDMILAGQSEVAFLRSPIAHGRIRRIVKPSGAENQVFIRADLGDVAAIVAPATVPGYKLSEWHPLAHEKVRFVGEAIAMCVAPTRAEAEDLSEQIEVEFDELPVLVDTQAARMESTVRVHEQWNDNVFLTLNYESGFEAKAKGAPVVIRREIALARQAMVPMEGKAVLARWDDRTDQLLVYASTQVPHIIRVGLAQFLGIDQGRVRVISPDVGGGFGYKCILQPEELCVAWLALKFRQPFRYVEDRREHLVVGANSRQHQYRLTAHADERGRLLALDADITIDGGAYSAWPFTVALEPGQATGNLPGPYDFRGYRCRTHCVATNKPGFLPYRGVARTGVCFALELVIDAIARAVGREPWEVRHDNLVSAADMPYDNVARKHYDSGDYRKALILAREKIGLDAWRERQRRGERDGRLIGIGFASYCEQTAHGTSVFSGWGLPIIPGYDQATPSQEGMALIVTALAYGVVAILLVFQMLMRLALIDVLIVLAPVAALLWVLPQTEHWARWWADLFPITVFQQAIQVMVLSLGTALMVELTPGSLSNALLTLMLGIAVCWLMLKVPSLLRSRGSQARNGSRSWSSMKTWNRPPVPLKMSPATRV